MPYYPKNRIQTNLYTNGGEFSIKSNSLPYSGYYYKLYNGEIYSGKNPNDGTPQLLIPTSELDVLNSDNVNDSLYNVLTPSNDTNVLDYLALVPKYPKDRKIPTPYYPDPSAQDYELGEITRYFVKKINEALYIEINQNEYNKIKDQNAQYLWEIYTAEALPWSISGNKNTVTQTNKNLTGLLEIRSKWYGFGKYILLTGGFDKFYK